MLLVCVRSRKSTVRCRAHPWRTSEVTGIMSKAHDALNRLKAGNARVASGYPSIRLEDFLKTQIGFFVGGDQ